ncbi:MAG: hypothetical protein ACREGF_04225 [Candidatus Saccharimonadales bacterium]
MKLYLLYGSNGAGKSAIGYELARRGYKVIEADSELGSWTNKKTDQKATHNPPFSQKWLDQNQWIWDEEKLQKLLNDKSYQTIFLVGNAYNMGQFMDLFTKNFFIYASFDTAVQRLQMREPERWLTRSAEVKQLENTLNNFWEGYLSNKPSNSVLIRNTGTVSRAANQILAEIDED